MHNEGENGGRDVRQMTKIKYRKTLNRPVFAF